MPYTFKTLATVFVCRTHTQSVLAIIMIIDITKDVWLCQDRDVLQTLDAIPLS